MNKKLKKGMVIVLLLLCSTLLFSKRVPIVVPFPVVVWWFPPIVSMIPKVVGHVDAPDDIDTIEEISAFVNAQMHINDMSKLEDLIDDMEYINNFAANLPSDPVNARIKFMEFVNWYSNSTLRTELNNTNPVNVGLETVKLAFLDMKTDIDDIDNYLDKKGLRLPDPLNMIREDLKGKIAALDHTISSFNKFVDPINHILFYMANSGEFLDNDLGLGSIEVTGKAYGAFGGSGIPLEGSLVYINEYPHKCARVGRDGEFTFSGLKPGMKVTFELFPVPNPNRFGEHNETEAMMKILSFMLTEFTGFIPTRTETFTIGNENLNKVELQAPSEIIIDLMGIFVNTNDSLSNAGIVQLTTTNLNHSHKGIENCTAKLKNLDGSDTGMTPFYFGSFRDVTDQDQYLDDFLALIASWFPDFDVNLVPVPCPEFTKTTYDGGIVFTHVPPGEYIVEVTDEKNNYIIRESRVKVTVGKVTNTTHPYGPHALSKIDDKERSAFLTPHGNDLLAYWGLNDRRSHDGNVNDNNAHNDIIHDFSGNSFHSTVTNSSWLPIKGKIKHVSTSQEPLLKEISDHAVDGVSGRSLAFVGNGYVDTTLNIMPHIDSANGATFEAWVNPEINNTLRYDFLSCKNYGWGLYIENNKVGVELGGQDWLTNVTLKNGEWHQLAVVYELDKTLLYKNSQLAATGPAPSFGGMGYELTIGANADSHNNNFIGALDSIAIYKKALSHAEIVAHFDEFRAIYIRDTTYYVNEQEYQNALTQKEEALDAIIDLNDEMLYYIRHGLATQEYIAACEAEMIILNAQLDDAEEYLEQLEAQRYHTINANGNIYVGPNVLVDGVADVTMTAGVAVVLKPGTHIKPGSKFHAKITK